LYRLLLVFLLLILGITFLILFFFLLNFYYALLFKVYYYSKEFLVKILGSGGNNASSSASQGSASQGSGSGGNPNQNNNNNNNNNSNNDSKIPSALRGKKPKRDIFSEPRVPKELREYNKEVDGLNKNLRGYTKKLEELKKHHDINYTLDSTGSLSIDVPASMSDSQAADLSRKVGIIDRLYNTQLETFKSVSSSALAKTEEFKKSSGSEPYTRNFLESYILYNGFIKDTYNDLFRNIK